MFLVRISTKKREWLGAFLLFLPTFLLLPIEFFGYKLLPFHRDNLELFIYTLIHFFKTCIQPGAHGLLIQCDASYDISQ